MIIPYVTGSIDITEARLRAAYNAVFVAENYSQEDEDIINSVVSYFILKNL